MSNDFIGLLVIWPPSGTYPPGHDQEYVVEISLMKGNLWD